ncbi:MAG: hypothetical protein AAGN35_25805 [Bacteroidota bacterium]
MNEQMQFPPELKSGKKPKGGTCGPVRFRGHIWCDDFVDVYLGTAAKVTRKLYSIDFQSEDPTRIEGQASCCDYLYFVGWSNKYGQNGFLAELTGTRTVRTGDPVWQVLATDNNVSSANHPRPRMAQVSAQIVIGNYRADWGAPFVGQSNDASGMPFAFTVPGIAPQARFVWHDSGNASGSRYPAGPNYHPFAGFDHAEFLVFRLPVKRLTRQECADCACPDPKCGDCQPYFDWHSIWLEEEMRQKAFTVPGTENHPQLCGAPSRPAFQCRDADLPEIKPCFFFHYGDPPAEQIEIQGTQAVLITVCNPFTNVSIRGLTITALTWSPNGRTTADGAAALRIVPDRLIHFPCLSSCTCHSTQLTMVARDTPPGKYSLRAQYCIESIELHGQRTGQTSFPMELKLE